MKIFLILLVVIVVLALLYVVGQYNALVVLRNKVKDQFSQIDIQLKRRFDLIPNLVETVKGYAKHEEGIFEEVAKLRSGYENAKTDAEKIAAGDAMTQGISKLFAVAEAYPELKANENFISLQNDLQDTEDKISYARQFYNDSVLKLNNKIEVFPSSIVANMFHFEKEKFFEANAEEKENVKVEF